MQNAIILEFYTLTSLIRSHIIVHNYGYQRHISYSYLLRTLIWNHTQSNLSLWPPLLSNHLYLKVTFFLSCHRKFIWIEPLLRGHLSYKTTFSLSQRWPYNTCFECIWWLQYFPGLSLTFIGSNSDCGVKHL